MVAQIGRLSGKCPKIFKCTGATPSSPLVFYDNPGPVSFIQYPMVHWVRVYGKTLLDLMKINFYSYQFKKMQQTSKLLIVK